MLRFSESACVQYGLCAATCPETAIRLAPRIDFAAWETPRRVLKEEQPFACTACGKPFEDCRVETVVNEGFDPHDATTRKVRTRDDYRHA